MTDQTYQTTHLGEVLTRVKLAVANTTEVTTDGYAYRPDRVVEDLATELGYDRRRLDARPQSPTLAEWLGIFEPNEEGAAWHKAFRLNEALYTLEKAGADPADLAVLRTALNLGPDRDRELAEYVDQMHERNRTQWMDRAVAEQAYAVSYAHRQGRLEALADLRTFDGAGLLVKWAEDVEGVKELESELQGLKRRAAEPENAA
jgi:hypothetical protein